MFKPAREADNQSGAIFKTKDYSKFTNFLGNRDRKPRKDLLNSIQDKGLINPIIVDRNFNVIDGQHRLEVCRTLGLAVEYMIRDLPENLIVDVNQHQVKWTPMDYLNRYVKLGNESYVVMAQMLKEHKLSIKQCYVMLRRGGSKVQKKEREVFEHGGFRIFADEIEHFHHTMGLMKDIFATAGGENEAKYRHGALFDALVKLINHPDYCHDRFISKLNEVPSHRIKQHGTIADMSIFLENTYNHGLRKGRIHLGKKTWTHQQQ